MDQKTEALDDKNFTGKTFVLASIKDAAKAVYFQFATFDCFIDNVRLKRTFKLSYPQTNKVLLKVPAYEIGERPSIIKARKLLKTGAIPINGVYYLLTKVKDKFLYWLKLTKNLNPINICKQRAITEGNYSMALDGEPYHQSNFINEFALEGEIPDFYKQGLTEVHCAYAQIEKDSSGISLAPNDFIEHLEINLSLYSTDPDNVLPILKKYADYLFGEPEKIGAMGTFIDYQISRIKSKSNGRSKNIKFYKKIKADLDNGKLGMVRCEMTIKNVPFQDESDIDVIIEKNKAELLSIAKWIFDATAYQAEVCPKDIKAFMGHDLLKSRAVTQAEIPKHLKQYFMEIKCNSKNARMVLKPQYSNLINN